MEEYKEYLKTFNEANNLKSYIANYIAENSTAASFDNDYLKHLKGIIKNDLETYYNSYNQTMLMYTGTPAYKNFSEYTGMSNAEFEDYLEEQSRSRAAINMTYQYIFTDAGLTITDADYETTVTAIGTSAAETYGKNYLMQMTMQEMVISYLSENVTIQ